MHIDISTSRKALNTVRRIHNKLISDALSKASSINDDYNLTIINSLTTRKSNLSKADVSYLNYYLNTY